MLMINSKLKKAVCILVLLAAYHLFWLLIQCFELYQFNGDEFEKVNDVSVSRYFIHNQSSLHGDKNASAKLNDNNNKSIVPRPHCKLRHMDFGIIHNCSRNNSKNIGIVSLHMAKANTYYNIKFIINNHVSYSKKYGHIYFEITKYWDEEIRSLHLNKNAAEHDKVLLSKISLIYSLIIEYKNSLEYILWTDFDALFWNCSQSIKHSILQKAEQMYNENGKDIIFAHGPDSIINSGIVLFKNSNWTLSFLKSMRLPSLQFADGINRINPGWGDQNIYIAMLMGYKNETLLEDFNNLLLSDPFWNSSIIETGGMVTIIDKNVTTRDTDGTWNRLTNHNISLDLHSKIDASLQNHVCILTPMDINFGYKFYNNKYIRERIQYEPFVMHFAGPGQKPYLKYKGRHVMIGNPTC